jgi:hypothetical protein
MTNQHIEATAVGQGYYRVFVNGLQESQHVAEREAMEAASKWKRDEPFSVVYYDHDYKVRIDLVDAPTPKPPVVVQPVIVPPPAPTQRITASDFELVGGWVLNQGFARSGLAIDFATMTAYGGGHVNEQKINRYELGPMGEGSDPAKWPKVNRSGTIDRFWPNVANSQGIRYAGMEIRDGVLWVSARGWYTNGDTKPLVIAGLNLTTGEVSQRTIPVSTQAYGNGFIKGHPTQWIAGCGGYSSGQSSVAGPTAVTVDGEVLLQQINFNIIDFDKRMKRPPTAWPKSGVDDFIAFKPRDGVGAWGADGVDAGGLWLDRGVCYWPTLGTGEGDYGDAKVRFSGGWVPWLCTYGSDWKDPQWSEWTHGRVNGHEVGPDGLVYLLSTESYRMDQYSTVPTIKVFRVKK